MIDIHPKSDIELSTADGQVMVGVPFHVGDSPSGGPGYFRRPRLFSWALR
jgi:hypothetical protein